MTLLYYCHQCDKIYSTKSDIQVHTDITHQDYSHLGDTSYKTNFDMIVHVDRVRELLCFTQTINEEDGVVGVDLPLSSTPDSRLGSKQPAEAKHFIVDPATKDMNI